ncbi:MAG TPA: YafY family protein [Thermoleophilaceae bacterium]|nr:YafY family protein [Thermoleophilaceae bacterium]
MTLTSGRLLRLLSLLQARRYWPGDELADRLEVSGRTIRRDVERLRELGYPVDATTGPDGGYRLEAGAAMPPLLLDDDEAVAIAVGLRTAAGASVSGIEETSVRALVKLEQVLPPHLRRRVNALQSATATLTQGSGGPQVHPEALTVIAGACRDRERLRFAYKARDGAETRRHAEPLSLVNLGRRWYLVAWDCDRRDWRTFRLDRIPKLPTAGGRFEPRTLPDGMDPATYVSKNLSGVQYRHQARVTLHAPAAEVEAGHRWARGQVEPIDEGSCSYAPSDDSLEWLALRIAFLGVDFEVHEPPELAEQCAALSRRFGAAAGAQSVETTRIE